jgi:hypothetical protein
MLSHLLGDVTIARPPRARDVEHIEGVLGSTRPPSTLLNLAGRRDEQQAREKV